MHNLFLEWAIYWLIIGNAQLGDTVELRYTPKDQGVRLHTVEISGKTGGKVPVLV